MIFDGQSVKLIDWGVEPAEDDDPYEQFVLDLLIKFFFEFHDPKDDTGTKQNTLRRIRSVLLKYGDRQKIDDCIEKFKNMGKGHIKKWLF